MQYEYVPTGVCSRKITFEIEDGIVKNVSFLAGCNGNGKGVSALCEGMDVEEVIRRLEGISCGLKHTSCPAQLALALKETTKQNESLAEIT